MQVWTLAYHNRTGTAAVILTTETAAYQALIAMIVDPADSQSLMIAKKMLFLGQLEELCTYLQRTHFGEWDDYRIQTHTLNITLTVPDEPQQPS